LRLVSQNEEKHPRQPERKKKKRRRRSEINEQPEIPAKKI
jgi:hypothetical protein